MGAVLSGHRAQNALTTANTQTFEEETLKQIRQHFPFELKSGAFFLLLLYIYS